MWAAFNIVMQIIEQPGRASDDGDGDLDAAGMNLAFRQGFMVGDYHWTIYGAILAAFGVAQVVWSNEGAVEPVQMLASPSRFKSPPMDRFEPRSSPSSVAADDI